MVVTKDKVYLEVLSKEQKELLPKLRFLKKEGFYLAGGTALALQLRHRTSIDFDFYRQRGFDSSRLLEKFQIEMKGLSIDVEKKDTLILKFKNSGISLFKYDYPIIKPFVETKDLLLLSLEDIAAMKTVALIQRGRKRDFVDIYFLLERFDVEKILKFTQEKYGRLYNEYAALRALAYFEDAEAEETSEEKRFQLLTRIGWHKIKEGIINRINLFMRQKVL